MAELIDEPRAWFLPVHDYGKYNPSTPWVKGGYEWWTDGAALFASPTQLPEIECCDRPDVSPFFEMFSNQEIAFSDWAKFPRDYKPARISGDEETHNAVDCVVDGHTFNLYYVLACEKMQPIEYAIHDECLIIRCQDGMSVIKQTVLE